MQQAAMPSEYALELLDAQKSFGKTQIIRGATLQVKPGDRVVFTSYAGEAFKVGDDELLLMREDDILSILG